MCRTLCHTTQVKPQLTATTHEMASSTLTDAAPVPADVDLGACVRALEDARAAVVRLTALVDRETAAATATALEKLLTTIEVPACMHAEAFTRGLEM